MDWQQGQRPPRGMSTVCSLGSLFGGWERRNELPHFRKFQTCLLQMAPTPWWALPRKGGAAVPELREPPLPHDTVHTPGSRYFCEYTQVWGCTDEGLRGSPAEPWASQRRTSLGLFVCLHPWLKFSIQGVIQVLFIQLNRKKSGAKNNNHTLVPEISKILKASNRKSHLPGPS